MNGFVNFLGKCPDLLSCATDCISKSTSNMASISNCLRRKCAFYCFNGSCPKCSAFITKLFNQVCISGSLRDKVQGFEVVFHELFSFFSFLRGKRIRKRRHDISDLLNDAPRSNNSFLT
ncbi:hypothetical protein TELCIR_18749, partial [Teladorsagia circumcincta]